ncbi:ATP-binding protein [Streptomyces atratus]|uniref:ATP-binding protein n=1 Tax=Streptomyces atratus TaxID=1893 RepID=UPI0033E263F8
MLTSTRPGRGPWSNSAPAGPADAAEPALTELIAHVVRHVPVRRASLPILRRPEGLRVEVTDECPKPPSPSPAPPPAGELAEDGRGLLPVAAVTDRWAWRSCRAGRAGQCGSSATARTGEAMPADRSCRQSAGPTSGAMRG